MFLEGLGNIEWRKATAAEPGRCSISGTKIKIGDFIYRTDHPEHRHWRILFDGYNQYLFERMKRALV